MNSVVRITDQHLLQTINKFPEEIRNDPTNRTFYLSLAVVQHFFGMQWANDHIEDNGKPGYIRLNWRDRTEAQKQSFRIVDLGEILFNLQHLDGFDDCIQKMREGDIEGTYAELDFGRMLYQSSVDFRFVKPLGKRRDDYDIEITMSDGTVVCADAKCKIETTDFSEATVLNSLRDARSQFPPDRPSIVFMKLPPHWLNARNNMKLILTEVAGRFLRNTGRIVSVKYYISFINWESGEVTHAQAFHEINNSCSVNRFGPSRNWNMFEESSYIVPNARGEYSNVPERWRRLMYYPEGLET
jgi:hypothetical protein